MDQTSQVGRVLMSLLFSSFFLFSAAQYGDFGLEIQPADSASVDDIIYYGDYMDMSGGYNVGDTVSNFTAYDFHGNPVELYDELAGIKPVILVSGSVSCIRFRNVFDPNLPAQETYSAREFIYANTETYNWIFVYGVEAHPTDGNCPSNCPQTINTDTAVVQPSVYAERRWAVQGWLDSPEHDFPFTMYADNPDNAVYNNFFQRPFGLIALNCDGTVGIRADWVTNHLADPDNVQELVEFGLNYGACAIDWTPETEEEEEDNDGDGDGDGDDGDEPVDYDGPDNALEGQGSNEVVNSIETLSPSTEVQIYPNPARDVLQVETESMLDRWMIVDLQGRSIFDLTPTSRSFKVDVSALHRGHYILMGQKDQAVVVSQRIILH